MQNFLSLCLNTLAQITHGGQVQRPRQKKKELKDFYFFSNLILTIEGYDRKPRQRRLYSQMHINIIVYTNDIVAQERARLRQ